MQYADNVHYAEPHPGLVPIKKLVHTEHGEIYRTYWVTKAAAKYLQKTGKAAPAGVDKRSEAKPAAKPETPKSVSQHAEKANEVESKIAAGWIKGFNTQQAADSRIAMAHAMGADFKRDLGRIAKDYGLPKVASFDKGSKGHDETQVAAAKSLAAKSQAAYKEETVTLYRGITKQHADALRSQAASNGGKAKVQVDSLAAFTEDKGRARIFAEGKGGMVITVKVPRSSIAMSHRALRGSFQKEEQEVVVANLGSFDINL